MSSTDLRRAFEFDPERATEKIVEFVRRVVEEAGAEGVVLGLSGGVDSALVAALCAKALGGDRVLGVIMPTEFTPREDVEDAVELARQLGIGVKLLEIQDVVDAFVKGLEIDRADKKYRIPLGNVVARVRMTMLYFYANVYNYLVAGTGDLSETLIGYFTKYGDGGADFFPIQHLYKTQVRALARYLGLPEEIAGKPSSPRLYPGHKLTDELPMDYDKIDLALVGLLNLKLPLEKVGELIGADVAAVKEILNRFHGSRHKREYPPSLVAHGGE